jgi:multidrug efflux system membrane fusion protein
MRLRYAAVAVALGTGFVTGCGERSSQAKGQPGGGGPAGARRQVQFPVEVTPVETRDVEYSVVAVGSVEAFEIVQMTSRVQGVVEAVRFAEGDRVQPGQALVEIEPERYKLAVETAHAEFEKAEAGRAEAEAGLSRREGANSKTAGIIPAEEIETWRTRLRTASAEVEFARAALEQAELNLRDAFVRTPVGGTIQTRSVQTGQFVQPGTTLATLLRRDPLLLRFAVPEQDAGRLAPGMTAQFHVRESAREFSARITHVAAAADPASRMVAVTAYVDLSGDGDPPRPGAFAEVTIPVGGTTASPVVPETAVRPSERGFLAYVVQDGKAHERILGLGMRTADGRVEVRQGLAHGESLVVRGAEALREGAAVRVVPAGTASAENVGRAPGAAGGNPANPTASGAGAPAGGREASAPAPRGRP